MCRNTAAITALIFALLTSTSWANGPSSDNFPIDKYLEPRVEFWVEIFTKYNTWQGVIHSTRYPQVQFAVVDNIDSPQTAVLIKKYSAILATLSTKKNRPENLNAEEKSIWQKYEQAGINEPERFSARKKGAESVRVQRGLRDQILDGYFRASRYQKHLLRLFEEQKIPEELIYLPLVESGFEHKAVSKAGASGIWQFMPQTGKIFLRVDSQVDERLDPIRSAAAAALFLKSNFQRLQTWPLAITAYNHGPAGMERASVKMGSKNISEIIQKYDSDTFGFASANYYVSFLAAAKVMSNSWLYFGEAPKAARLEFDEFILPDPVFIQDLVEYTALDSKELRDLNPALLETVWSGKLPVPVGYILRLPMHSRDYFLTKFESIPAQKRGRQSTSTVK